MCAHSRVRCSGGVPCDHCSARHLECQYRPRKRRRLTSRGSPAEPASVLDSHTAFPDDPAGRLCHNADPSPGAGGASSWPAIQEPPPPLSSTAALFHQGGGTPIATNWLPFVHADLGEALGYADDAVPARTGVIAEMAPTVGSRVEGTGLEDLEHAFFFQQDQVSALIKSMQNGSLAVAESCGSDCTTSSHNRLYADGAGFRESQSDRSILERRAAFPRHSPSIGGQQTGLSSTAFLLERIRVEKVKGVRLELEIPEPIFHEMESRLCPLVGRPLLSAESLAQREILLTRDTFNFLIRLYFDHFHPLYPFLDRSLLCIPVWGWSLVLATAAIGTRYLGLAELTRFGDDLCGALHELLIREVCLLVPYRFHVASPLL